MLRRTPCVGICSTTYGDLVCRGCKRFAHEIVQWNGFDPAQRQTVWGRLLALRGGAVAAVLEVVDESRLRGQARRLGVAAADELDIETLAYELLQRVPWRDPEVTTADLGIRASSHALTLRPEDLLALVDQEFYARSVAHYERNYRIPAE